MPLQELVLQGRLCIVAQRGFTAEELEHLSALRQRYAQSGDVFSEREFAYLRFMRWLVQTSCIKTRVEDAE